LSVIPGPTAEAIAQFEAGLARFWHPVCLDDDLPLDAPIGVELLGRNLVVVRLKGGIACFDDLCRHMGSALSIGEVVDGNLRCRYHGWTYDRSGKVVDIPARRDLPIPREACVESHLVEARHGLIWVCLAAEPAADIPAYPEADDEKFHRTPYRTYKPWAASATRVVMAALDDTHFPWVHPGTLGDPTHPEAPDHQASVEKDHVLSTYSMEQPANISVSSTGWGTGLEKVTYTNRAYPTTIHLTKKSPGGVFVLFQAMQPLAHNRSRIFLQVARNYDLDPAQDDRYLEFEDGIQAQDKPVVESQRPWLLPPLSSRLMLYVRPADLPLVTYQKWMEDLGIPQI
jgi:vanillate O-demethylase monooxygenase subunit